MPRIEAAWNQLVELVAKLGPNGLTVIAGMGLHDPIEENTDAVNDAVWKLHRNDTPEHALTYFRESHAHLVAALGKLSDADLDKPYSHYQPSDRDEKRPVVGWVAGNTYEHYAEHIGWINQLISESRAAR